MSDDFALFLSSASYSRQSYGADVVESTQNPNLNPGMESLENETIQPGLGNIATTSSNVSTDIFHIDKRAIPSTSAHDEELSMLGVCAYDQNEFENEIMGQVDKALKLKQEQARKEKIAREVKSVTTDIQFVKHRLLQLNKALSMAPRDEALMTHAAKREIISIQKEQENKLKHLKKLEAKMRFLSASSSTDNLLDVQDNLDDDNSDMDAETKAHLQAVFAPKETEDEKLIRTGQMTPFGTVLSSDENRKTRKIIIPDNQLTDFDKFLMEQVATNQRHKSFKSKQHKTPSKLASKTKPLASASTVHSNTYDQPSCSSAYKVAAHKERNTSSPKSKKLKLDHNCVNETNIKSRKFKAVTKLENTEDLSGSDKEYVPDGISEASDIDEGENCSKGKMSVAKCEKKLQKSKTGRIIDDGCQKSYIKRLRDYEKELLIKKHQRILESEDGIVDSDDESYTEFDSEFKVPMSVWTKLYKYQQTGVRWLWELHQQHCGGIVGDEMGLGKTIQVIAFLVGLKMSNLLCNGDRYQGLGPIVLVCPTTVMHQWVKEFHLWWPPFRVAILHDTGSYAGQKGHLVGIINEKNGVIITSYVGLVLHQVPLLRHEWHYVILDEGHKIRNPDSQATLVAKQFRTPHRLILSGSPIQNNLKELWSLFDFIFPGKLGTLPIFMQQFSVPIVQGGYANATQVQVQTAFKCASVLRDTIKPYLLRRMKDDVKMSIQLPNKNEQVLFCKLTDEQIEMYKQYLGTGEVEGILNARLKIFVGLIKLRKICNHPDLFTGGPRIFKDTDVSALPEVMKYGYYRRSGKMIVVETLLSIWKKQGHRVLLFTQGRQMMNILEVFIQSRNYKYLKMDGSTSISSRQPTIAKFNNDNTFFVFLLTTRVGGLGVNLTGADRVIIFDPDWNPSTDGQAKERSWRIGQDKQVTIYRLLTAGTIEEKIYHRQIFKQFVTNRVLKDPRQRRFFKSNDLYELFTYSEMGENGTETSAIFAGTGSEIKPIQRKSEDEKFQKKKAFWSSSDIKASFSSEKIEKMKELAKRLSGQLVKNNSDNGNASEIDILNQLNSKKESNVSNDCVAAIDCNQNSTCNTLKKDKTTKLKERRKHKKKRKKNVVDGETIDYLVKTDEYSNSNESHENNSKNDDYVLNRLFKKSGVHTALKHDIIVDASDPDYMLVEGEANRVAQDAIKVLKQSRRQCARAIDGVPTWTGSNGSIRPRFGLKKKLPLSSSTASTSTTVPEIDPGPSGINKSTNFEEISFKSYPLTSSEMLAAIKKRKNVFGERSRYSDSSDEDVDANIPPTSASTEYDELLVNIRNFIAFRASVDGRATTQELLAEFKQELPKEHTVVFKSLLSKICDFSRASHGDGLWYLKEEFR